MRLSRVLTCCLWRALLHQPLVQARGCRARDRDNGRGRTSLHNRRRNSGRWRKYPPILNQESRTRDARQKRSTQCKEARGRDAIKAISEGTEMASATYDEPHAMSQSKKAAASGWIGSALEYYDFFIYATAASLVFPQIFFPSANPTTAIVASLATYGVGYVARPIGAFVLGHWGDTHGRKTVLIVCMVLMGFSTMAVGLLPPYQQVAWRPPALRAAPRLIQGLAAARHISAALSMIL